MNLIAINSKSKYLDKIQEIFLSSFPENERIDFEDLVNCKFPNSNLLGIFNDEILVGFSYVSVFGDLVYIVYFAIDEKERNKKYGTQALNKIFNIYKGKTKVLSVEKPLTQGDTQSKRIDFYKRNGYELATFEFEWEGQTYCPMFNGEFDRQKFIEFLLICFPGCENFRDVVNIKDL